MYEKICVFFKKKKKCHSKELKDVSEKKNDNFFPHVQLTCRDKSFFCVPPEHVIFCVLFCRDDKFQTGTDEIWMTCYQNICEYRFHEMIVIHTKHHCNDKKRSQEKRKKENIYFMSSMVCLPLFFIILVQIVSHLELFVQYQIAFLVFFFSIPIH